ncbi:MAG: BadF/BadG/BcrA/BcrD ATPase family protein, partial [Trueperaceae bacterium]
AATAAEALLQEALGAPAGSVRVMNDMRLAYRSAFLPGEGVLVHTGTGAIAVHLTRDLRLLRAGGHGPWIDGAGGGFWIGARALRTVLREADRSGRTATGPLADAIHAAVGASDPSEVRAWAERGGTRAVSDLVPAVRHAAFAGDPAADAIVKRAGSELARLADALLQRVGPLPVGLAGGASGLGPPLRRALVAELPPGTAVRMAERTPVEAAATLAERAVAERAAT